MSSTIHRTEQNLKSSYSAAFTAASMMYREMTAIVPLLSDENASELLKKEIEEKNERLFNKALAIFIGFPALFAIGFYFWVLYEVSKL